MSSTSKHPKGLLFLAFTEFWERFGYYLMIGIFFLYMTDTETGGLGWENAKAADVFGTFIACVYLTPFIGGLMAAIIAWLTVSFHFIKAARSNPSDSLRYE